MQLALLKKAQILKISIVPPSLDGDGCGYTAGSKVSVVDTPFGRTTSLVCADAYTYDVTTLDKVKLLKPDVVIVPWGVAADKQEECGQQGFNATAYAAQTAKYLWALSAFRVLWQQ